MQISSKEKWWRIEMWRRIYPDLQMADILMRMHPDKSERSWGLDRCVRNAMNMRCSRKIYGAYLMLSWFGKGLERKQAKAREQVLAYLNHRQNHLHTPNSTRGVAPGLCVLNCPDFAFNRNRQPDVRHQDIQRKLGGRGRSLPEKPSGKRRRDDDDDDLDADYVVKRRPGRPSRSHNVSTSRHHLPFSNDFAEQLPLSPPPSRHQASRG